MKVDVKVEAEFLASIAQNSHVVDKDVLDHVLPDYFSAESYQWYVKQLQKREWKVPSFDFLDQLLLEFEDEEKRTKYRDQLYFLYSKSLEFVQDASDTMRGYISYCKINSLVSESFQKFGRAKRVDLLLKDLKTGIFQAQNILDSEAMRVTDYAETYQERQLKRKLHRDNPTLNPVIKTGINQLDVQFQLKAPMIVDFMAPFKRYKSVFLNAFGYSALLQGYNVLHVVYENSKDLTMARYDSMFSELNYYRVDNGVLTPDEKHKMDAMFDWMGKWPNRLKLIKSTPKKTTMFDIEEICNSEYEKTGFKEDVIILDYVNIMGSSVKSKEERLDQEQILWDIKQVADRRNSLVLTATQSNMTGVAEGRLSDTSRGKSIGISQALDVSIAIDQTKEEKEEGIICLSPKFARGFEISIPEIILDTDISRMCVSKELHNLWNEAVKINPY
jgi:hypothetical protein